jgi:hypothetical protein
LERRLDRVNQVGRVFPHDQCGQPQLIPAFLPRQGGCEIQYPIQGEQRFV